MKRANSSSYAGPGLADAQKKGKWSEESGPSFEEELGMMDQCNFEIIEGADGAENAEDQEKRWARPAASQWNSQSKPLAFHWLDIDMTSGSPMTFNPDGTDVHGSLEGPVAIIRMYGVTSEGQSVMANVHGFIPYFYVSFPSSTDISDSALGQLRIVLDERVNNTTCVFACKLGELLLL